MLLQAVTNSCLPVVSCPVPHPAEHLAFPINTITNLEAAPGHNLLVQHKQVQRLAVEHSIWELGSVDVSSLPMTHEADEIRQELLLPDITNGGTATAMRRDRLQRSQDSKDQWR